MRLASFNLNLIFQFIENSYASSINCCIKGTFFWSMAKGWQIKHDLCYVPNQQITLHSAWEMWSSGLSLGLASYTSTDKSSLANIYCFLCCMGLNSSSVMSLHELVAKGWKISAQKKTKHLNSYTFLCSESWLYRHICVLLRMLIGYLLIILIQFGVFI